VKRTVVLAALILCMACIALADTPPTQMTQTPADDSQPVSYYPSVSPDSLYFKAYVGTALMSAAKSANPAPVNVVAMDFQQIQSVPCMDPQGSYVYEVASSNLRRFSTTDGSYTDVALSHAGVQVCATDGNHIFVPNGDSVHKYTMTGTYVNTTTLNIACDPFAFALVNDTVWASPDRDSEVFYGYAASGFGGGTITPEQTWHVGAGTNGTGNIAWDNTYYYVIWIGTSPITFKRFTADRTLYDSGEVSGIDPRSVMCTWTPQAAVAEPDGPTPVAASLAVTPNPIACGFATLRYSLPGTGPATITVFDVSGRPTYRHAVTAERDGAAKLDLRELRGGVYLVLLDAGAHTVAQKLVVRR